MPWDPTLSGPSKPTGLVLWDISVKKKRRKKNSVLNSRSQCSHLALHGLTFIVGKNLWSFFIPAGICFVWLLRWFLKVLVLPVHAQFLVTRETAILNQSPVRRDYSSSLLNAIYFALFFDGNTLREGGKRYQFKYLATNLPFGWFSHKALNLVLDFILFMRKKRFFFILFLLQLPV